MRRSGTSRLLEDAEMLPAIVPKTRIAGDNYDSRWHSDSPETGLQSCGKDLLRSLHNFRRVADHVIVFTGHSLGGSLIQHIRAWAQLCEITFDTFAHTFTTRITVTLLSSITTLAT